MESNLYRDVALPSITDIMVRAAELNLPIKTISKIVRLPTGSVRSALRSFRQKGLISTIPPDDWDVLGAAGSALPSQRKIKSGQWDADVSDAAELFGLPISQAAILMAMVRRPGQSLNEEAILDACSLTPYGIRSNLCRVRIHELRQALTPHGVEIMTRRGYGYSVTRDTAKNIVDRINEYRRRALSCAA
jgi:hypothetical protein